jgi:hypothetical protein
VQARLAEAEKKLATSAKVPWFVDGETKEAIGRVLDYGDRIAWNDDVGGPITAVPVRIFFADEDCRGEERSGSNGNRAPYWILADGRVVEHVPENGPFVGRSQLVPGRPCANQMSSPGDAPLAFKPTGAELPVPGLRLIVEMR